MHFITLNHKLCKKAKLEQFYTFPSRVTPESAYPSRYRRSSAHLGRKEARIPWRGLCVNPVRREGPDEQTTKCSFLDILENNLVQGSSYFLGQRFCVHSSRICTPSLFSPSPLCGGSFNTRQALNLWPNKYLDPCILHTYVILVTHVL